LRIAGIILGAVTLVGGSAVTPGVMAAVFRNVEWAQLVAIGVAIVLACFVSCLLISPDRIFRRYRGVVYAGVTTAAGEAVALFVALALAPAFEESSLGAGLYGFLGAWGGVFLLADAVLLSVRLRRAGRAPA
jgi:hypothetical protein